MGNKILFKFCKKEKSKTIKAKAYGLLKYCCDKALQVDTFNMVNGGYDNNTSIEDRKKAILKYNKEFVRLQRLNGHCQYDKRKAYHYCISPEDKNVDKDVLINMAKDFLQQNYPNGQAIITIHNDNGRNHCHIAINSVMTDLKKIQYSMNETKDTRIIKAKNGKEYTCKINNNVINYKAQVKYVEETLAKKYNFEITTEKQRKKIENPKVKHTQLDYQYEKYRHTPTDKTYIQDTTYQLLYIEKIDKGQFIEKCKEKNIDITTYKDSNNQIQYRYHYNKHSFSGATLGNIFEYDTINKLKVNEKEQTKVMEETKQEKSNDNSYLDYISQLSSNYDNDVKQDNIIDKLTKDITKQLKDNDLWNEENKKLLKDVLSPTDKNTPKKVIIDNLNKLNISITKQIANIGINYVKDTIKQGMYSNGRG